MKLWRLFGVGLVTLGAHFVAASGELDDCVLNGLKGVNSDAAARMVRQACESKVAAARVDRMIAKYGTRAYESMEVITWNQLGGGIKAQASIRNTSDLTAMLIEVSLSTPDSQGYCMNARIKKELYRVKLKPRSNGVFVLGDVAQVVDKKGGLCIDAMLVRGREPSAFDFSVGSFEPLSAREVETINDELKERYAQIEPPHNASGLPFDVDLRKLFAPPGTGTLKK